MLVLGMLVVLGFTQCEDKEKPFTLVGTWRVVRVELGGQEDPENAELGKTYEFKDDGTCRIWAEGQKDRKITRSYKRDATQHVLHIGDYSYRLYVAEEGRVVFGSVDSNGRQLVTYTLN